MHAQPRGCAAQQAQRRLARCLGPARRKQDAWSQRGTASQKARCAAARIARPRQPRRRGSVAGAANERCGGGARSWWGALLRNKACAVWWGAPAPAARRAERRRARCCGACARRRVRPRACAARERFSSVNCTTYPPGRLSYEARTQRRAQRRVMDAGINSMHARAAGRRISASLLRRGASAERRHVWEAEDAAQAHRSLRGNACNATSDAGGAESGRIALRRVLRTCAAAAPVSHTHTTARERPPSSSPARTAAESCGSGMRNVPAAAADAAAAPAATPSSSPLPSDTSTTSGGVGEASMAASSAALTALRVAGSV